MTKCFRGLRFRGKARIFWCYATRALLWSTWKERNQWIFKDKSFDVHCFRASVKYTSSWVWEMIESLGVRRGFQVIFGPLLDSTFLFRLLWLSVFVIILLVFFYLIGALLCRLTSFCGFFFCMPMYSFLCFIVKVWFFINICIYTHSCLLGDVLTLRNSFVIIAFS